MQILQPPAGAKRLLDGAAQQQVDVFAHHVGSDAPALEFERVHDRWTVREQMVEFFVSGLQLLRSLFQFDVFLLQFPHQPLVVFLYQGKFVRGANCLRLAALPVVDHLMQGLKNFVRRRRFLEKPVGAQIQRGLLVARRGVGAGVDDERDVAELLALAQFEAEAVAIHLRHEDVGNNHVNLFSLQDLERLDAIGGLNHPEAFGFQHCAEQSTVDRVVINNENVHGERSPSCRVACFFATTSLSCCARVRVFMGLTR